MEKQKKRTLAVLGGTGPIARRFIEQFRLEGILIRLLARDPGRAAEAYPFANVIQGSMLEPEDIRRALQHSDAAFLITPIGPNNEVGVEAQAARAAVTAGQSAGLPHLLFLSVIGIDQPTGVPLLDAKREVEELLAGSGLGWSSLRAGSFMDDVIDSRARFFRLGWWPHPVPVMMPVSFTAQRDIARAAARLLREGRPLNSSVDVIEPLTRTPAQVASVISELAGRRVRASGNKLLLPLLRGIRPILRRANPRLVTITTLVEYFARVPYTGDTAQLEQWLPGFTPTSLEEHLQELFRSSPHLAWSRSTTDHRLRH